MNLNSNYANEMSLKRYTQMAMKGSNGMKENNVMEWE
jgi:hypothetical protein